VSKGLFELLGLTPIVGRTFTAEEYVPGGGDRVVLTEGFARRVFGDPAQSLEQTLTLAGRPFTVVGVMAGGTEAPEHTQLYRPLPYDSTFSAQTELGRRGEFLIVIGRMRAGATTATVEQDVRRIGAELADRFPATNGEVTLTSIPLTQVLVGDVRTPLLVLLGAVGLVLLVACANVANLLLARATAREGELAVRAALGAGRSRLVRQLLTESLVLAGAGAVMGLLLAWGGTRALVAAQPADIPRLDSIRISGVVVAFTASIAILTGLLFGALPALQATGTRMMQALRESGRGALSNARGQHIRAALVVAELGLAVMLLVGAGLLIRSFVEMTRMETGFETTNAVAFRVSLQGPAYAEAEARRRFFDQLGERLRAVPGVTSVGAASGLPMTDMVSLLGPFQVDGVEVPPGVLPEIRLITVTPEYFATLGTPLLMGRALSDRDIAESPPVALFNHAAIARWFADGDPIGERVRLGGSTREVVGVVGDVLQRAPGIPVEPEMYVPHAQRAVGTMRFVVRGPGDMTPIAARIRSEVHALDPQLPIASVDPLDSLFSNAVARPRFYTTLLTLFAGVALTLAVIGIFGVMSYLVAQRAHEISIRMALGADRTAVVGMIVGRAMTVAAAGLIAGIAGAMAVSGVLRSQLFGVDTTDPITLGAVLVILGASALLASLLPALRASRLDPGAVLREG
jgi:predicted permease